MVVFIPHRFPTRNEQEKAARSHRMLAAKMKKRNTEIAQMYFVDKEPVKGKQIFIFIWREPNMRTDPDNISAGCKFIFDGMQKAGFLENDGWQQVDRITHFFERAITPKHKGVVVEVICAD